MDHNVCLSVCLSVGRSVPKIIFPNFEMSLPSPNLPSPPFDKVMQFPSPTQMRNKQIRNNFDRQWGGGRLCSIYFNYTPAP